MALRVLVDSCAGCHGRPRGSAGFGGDVVTRPDSRDAPHLLRRARNTVTRTLSSKGINYGFIRAFPNGNVDTGGVRGVDRDLRVRPFFAHGGTISIREFVAGAFNDEMGLQAVDPLLVQAAAGARIITPSGMVLDGSKDTLQRPLATTANDDPDADGKFNEIPTALVDHMEFYLFNYFKPGTYRQTQMTQAGLQLMRQINCTACHVQNLTVNTDRRVADVETVYDSQRGIFNDLFATATLLVVEQNDGSGFPSVKVPAQNSFVVRNFFADMKRHDLVLFPPDDTASNLDPGDPNAAGFPQRGHGSIRLPVVFNDPTELE